MTVQYDKLIDLERLEAFKGMCDDEYASGAHTHSYAGAPSSGGNANTANAILYGTVASTSTATAYTATVAGLEQLVDGTCVMLHNGVVTSASGFTVNINNLGAKKCYNNMTLATQDTTIFNINYTMLFIYAEDLDGGNGGFWIYRGYNSDNNTIGYQLRTNATAMPTVTRTRYYRLLFTSADRTKWVPANTGYDNSATSTKTVNQNAIDPHGCIVYMTGTTNVNANANVGATVVWSRYALNLGYSFNTTGAALTLTFPAPVFVKCAPQSNGSAIIDSTTPYVQALPSTADGKIYIYLGMAYSATNIELVDEHPVYWHDGTGIRIWTGAEQSSVEPSSTTPSMDGTAAVGTATTYARADHVHPTDTSRLRGIVLDTSSEPYDVPVANSLATISIGDGLNVSDSGNTATLSAKTGTTSGTVAAGNHTHSGYQATLVSGTNIKTINNESLLGSGNITTPTYTLPTASTSTLGGVKVDGTTITAAADGTISASGGGGGSTVTLYTNGSYSNLWTDQSLSTTLLDYAGYDYKAAYDILHDSSSVYVENSNNNQGSARYGVVLAAFFDSVDETLYALVAHEMANISSSTIGSVLRHVSCS